MKTGKIYQGIGQIGGREKGLEERERSNIGGERKQRGLI
jgi:hypothetical protein